MNLTQRRGAAFKSMGDEIARLRSTLSTQATEIARLTAENVELRAELEILREMARDYDSAAYAARKEGGRT